MDLNMSMKQQERQNFWDMFLKPYENLDSGKLIILNLYFYSLFYCQMFKNHSEKKTRESLRSGSLKVKTLT